MRTQAKGEPTKSPLTAWYERCLQYVPRIGWYTCREVIRQSPQRRKER